jgi:hypothetical protein
MLLKRIQSYKTIEGTSDKGVLRDGITSYKTNYDLKKPTRFPVKQL